MPAFLLILKHLYEISADNGTGFEAHVFGLVGPYPVGHRHAVLRFVLESVDAVYVVLEFLLAVGQGYRWRSP